MQKSSHEDQIKSWQEHLKSKNADYFYLSSFDNFLSEYVPVNDSMRVYLTGFTGSVAEALVPSEGRVLLFVDARYHEQADLECDSSVVEVVKVPYGKPLTEAMLERLGEGKTVGLIGERTHQLLKDEFDKRGKSLFLKMDDFSRATAFNGEKFSGELFEPPHERIGLKEKWHQVLKEGDFAFINALDSLAWVSGLRAHHLPYQGTFRGYGLLTGDDLHIFVPQENYKEVKKFENPYRKVYTEDKREEVFTALLNQHKPEKVWWDPKFTTASSYKLIEKVFGKNFLAEKSFHSDWQAFKNQKEKEAFRKSFEKSDQAIYEGLSWLVDSIRNGTEVSELEFRDYVNDCYQKKGAKCQSFRTIAGFGSNSSIIHFGSPSAERLYKKGELVLLDSGAIYEQGMATDCTRTVLPLGNPTEDQKKEYTLVLKGLIKIMKASIPKGTPGRVLDEMARESLKEHGLDYGHGTGHGVGINVHEAGYSITPTSEVPLIPGLVGSMEPGFYKPGVGGIRLENIVIVEEDPNNAANVIFDNLVYIGFWEELIDYELLTEDERSWLSTYEKECSARGRSFAKFFQ